MEERYNSSPIEHAPTETTGCIVVPDQNNRLICYTGTQAIFFTLDNASIILDLPGQRLHFIGGRRTADGGRRTAGGGFGGKVDCTVEPITLLATMLTDRPVAFIYNRYEEMQISSPRAAERIYIKDGLMKDGRIVGPSGPLLYRFRRLFAAFALRRTEGGCAFPRPLYDPECGNRLLLRLHQPDTVERHAPDSASPSGTSPSKCRWTSSRAASVWTRWNFVSSTPIATAT